MKKIIDHNGRLFGLISIIDVIVLLVVAVLAVALVLKQSAVSPAASTGTASTEVSYTLISRNLKAEVAENIQVGDALFDRGQETNGTIGTISEITMTPAVRTVLLPDGTTNTAISEGYYDVTITVDSTCDIVDGHYRFNNVYELGVNASRTFHTQFVVFVASVTEIG